MIFEELLYVFRNDLEIEYLKRNIKETNKIRFNQKQLKLIFTKIASDLQKEFKIIESEQTITTVAGEASYALTRDFMNRKSAYYETKKLDYVSMEEIYNGITSASYPLRYGIKWVNSYPYIVLNPTPNESGKSIYVKSYNDIKLYSINDGIDDKAADPSDDTLYMKIPTMYDAAILKGMMSEIFDDRLPLYEAEKLRLKSMGNIELSLDYNMTGIPVSTSKDYNSDADATPSTLPADPA